MKNIIFILSALSIIMMAASCDPDPIDVEETTTVDLNFKAVYGAPDEVMLLQKIYNYEDNTKIKFTNMSFYISEVALLTDDAGSEETQLTEVELLKFNFYDTDSLEALSGNTISLDNIPVGNYAGIRISIGVPADLNRTVPEDYGMGHPLASVEHYWSGWSSYIFSKIEGFTDDNNDGILDLGLTYHTGMDASFREKYIFTDIKLSVDENKTLNFNLDLKQLFFDGADAIDIIANPESHSGNEVSQEIMDNFVNAISIR